MVSRVLYVDSVQVLGGAEISLLTLMGGLRGTGFAPRLLTAQSSALADVAREAGIPVSAQSFHWFRKRRPWQYPQSIWQLCRTIWQQRIGLVHTNCDHSLGYVMRASRLTGRPYVSHVRDFVRTWFSAEHVEALCQAARVIANSHAVAQACVEAGIPSERVETVYNPVDVDAFSSVPPWEGQAVRSEEGLPADVLVVGLIGQIQPIKGHQEFIETGLRIAELFPQVYFLVVGAVAPGAEKQRFFGCLRAVVANSDHTERFRFLGFRHDVGRVLRAIDILAVPSWREPFGRVAVEGMASGCAVIGTEAGGLPEIVTDNVNGLLVPPRDGEALFQALCRLIADPALRQRLAQNARASVSRFAVSRHVEQMVALYARVLAGHEG